MAVADQTVGVAVQVRKLFDAKAAAWPSKYAPGGRLTSRQTLLGSAVTYHVPEGGSVLDLGCGTGELAGALAEVGRRVTGCDISPEMLQRALSAGLSRTIDWVQLEPGWQELPFMPETFDAVVASSVLEYVDDPVAILRECRRTLRPGGVVICTVPDPRHPVRWLEWFLGIGARVPIVRIGCRMSTKLQGYAIYLSLSRQRHSFRWWSTAAARASLHAIPLVPHIAERSPLRMLAFERRKSTVE
jgi:SAM-dependent methyltransferase